MARLSPRPGGVEDLAVSKAGTLRERVDAAISSAFYLSEPYAVAEAAIALCREEFARVAEEFHLKRHREHSTIADAIRKHEVGE